MTEILEQVATAVAIMLASAVALLGLYGAIAGIPSSYVMVSDAKEETIMFQYHYTAGLFYALAAVMIAYNYPAKLSKLPKIMIYLDFNPAILRVAQQ